jgi:hypothetical protein
MTKTVQKNPHKFEIRVTQEDFRAANLYEADEFYIFSIKEIPMG